MSLLGKKRTKRDDEDEKVRYNLIIVTNYNLLFKKEYEQMFGIKGEEPKKDENNSEKEDKNNILKKEEKIENKDIKIVEITINLPKKEKIKSRTYKKEKKIINIEEKPIISLFPVSSQTDNKKKIEIKEEKNEVIKKITNNSIFNTKPMDNPFLSFNDNKETINKENNIDKPKLSLFGNLNNKDEKKEVKPQISLFGNKNNNNNKDEKKEIKPQLSLFENQNNNNSKEEKKEIKPQISLFGNQNNNKEENKETKPQPQPSFPEKTNDDKDNKNNNTSLFGNSLFSSNNNKSLFSGNFSLFSGNSNNNSNSLFSGNGGKSLFGNNNNKPLFSNTNNNNNEKNSIPLFSNNNISNPFSQIKGELFLKNISNNNNSDNKKNESLFGDNANNEENEEDDERDKPKTKYVAEPLKAQDYSNYSKLYNTHLSNLFLYSKAEKKFISKGNGFFSIEKTKEDNKQHQAVVVFRNQTGNKLVEGFVDKTIDKFDIYNKEFNYVVSFGIIMMSDGKPELGFIKIPFKNEENANELKDAFGKAIKFLEEK